MQMKIGEKTFSLLLLHQIKVRLSNFTHGKYDQRSLWTLLKTAEGGACHSTADNSAFHAVAILMC